MTPAREPKRPSIVPIGDGRRISQERNVPIVVIFAIHANRDEFTVTTYGATKALCRVAADYGTQFAEAVMKARVIAQPTEPVHLPDEPTVWRSLTRSEEGEGGETHADSERA